MTDAPNALAMGQEAMLGLFVMGSCTGVAYIACRWRADQLGAALHRAAKSRGQALASKDTDLVQVHLGGRPDEYRKEYARKLARLREADPVLAASLEAMDRTARAVLWLGLAQAVLFALATCFV